MSEIANNLWGKVYIYCCVIVLCSFVLVAKGHSQHSYPI